MKVEEEPQQQVDEGQKEQVSKFNEISANPAYHNPMTNGRCDCCRRGGEVRASGGAESLPECREAERSR